MSAYSTEFDSEQLLRLSEEVSRIAGALAQLSVGAGTSESGGAPKAAAVETEGKNELCRDTVRWLIKARRQRARYLSSELFAEPAWDILLDLLQAELAQHRIPVSSLCIAAGVPNTTGLRWISNMVKQGLLVRRPDQHDGRRIFVELAPGTSAALRQYFADVGQPEGSRAA